MVMPRGILGRMAPIQQLVCWFLAALWSSSVAPVVVVHGLASTSTTTTPDNNAALGMTPPQRLRQLLNRYESQEQEDLPLILPCCYDGLTARLVARAGFEATFMTGFGVSAVRGYSDTQLVSYDEMLNHASLVAEGLESVALEQQPQQRRQDHVGPIPCIADGDTGYGNAVNVKRTVFGYGRANMAGIMIEDQVAPKRCGHVAGKSTIPFPEAVQRVRAASDARDEYEALYGPGTGPLILARTDAVQTEGFEAAIERCLAFREAGCDMTFLEAPESVEQMAEYCRRVPGPKLANMLEHGSTPILPPRQLKQLGYTLAAYPLTLLSASIKAMEASLDCLKRGVPTDPHIASFAHTKDAVGFTRYADEERRYRTTN